MFLPFYYYLKDTSQEVNDIFVKIGRALYVATRFESYCRTLNILLDLKSNVNKGELSLENDDQVNKFVNNILKSSLHKHIIFILELFHFNSDIPKLIFNAKNARNYIAHEITLGMEQSTENDASFLEVKYKEIDDSITKILDAEFIIINIIALATHDNLPPTNYIEKNKLWVLS